MQLSKLHQAVAGAFIHASSDPDIKRITTDSRDVGPGDLFFPRKGEHHDGADFIPQAIENGASCIVTPSVIDTGVAQLVTTPDVACLRTLCTTLYDHPSRKMNVVGVTGTNGKTSICHFVEAFVKEQGMRAGNIGSTEYRWVDQSVASKLTTPMYEDLQHVLWRMQQDQVDVVAMECSSHGIELERIADIDFDICVYTNLTHEHLDFHHTMQAYEEAKKKLFTRDLANSCKRKKLAVINTHDEVGQKWAAQNVSPHITTYDLKKGADVYPISIDAQFDGMDITLSFFGERLSFHTPIIGTYNVMNLMAAMLVGRHLGIAASTMVSPIESGIWVPGRLQKVDIDAPFTVIVDYAYTEDALFNVLTTLKPFATQKIIAVFGAGGDRDPTRRAKMARTVYKHADTVIITTDNPRTEDPEAIIQEVKAGIDQEPGFQDRVHVEIDREKAIAKSLQIASQDDIILIAGKGHETYQEIHGVRHPFDDREVIKKCWRP